MRRPDAHLEADILAAALHDPELHVRKLLTLLDADDFDSVQGKAVFVAISNVAKVGGVAAVSYATVHDELRRTGADSRDMLHLLDPDLGLGPIGSFEPKCRRLRESRQERMVQSGMMNLMERSWDHPQQLIDAVTELREQALALTPRDAKSFEDVVDEMVEVVEYDAQHKEQRIKTGLPTLDAYLHGGLAPGWMVVVGARTGVGKTTFAIQVATKAAVAGHRVIVFSMEEAPTQVAERVIRYHQKLPRTVNHADVDALVAAAFTDEVRQLPIELLQEHRLDAICNEVAEQCIERGGVGLVIVDYAGLVQAPGHYDSRVQEIGEVTRQLKLAAMELKVPVMLLAQVNRSPMSRTDKRPQLSDLRDSGALEQDADVVILLHHDDQSSLEDSLRLAKHRYGPTGEMPVRYDYPIGRLEELSHIAPGIVQHH